MYYVQNVISIESVVCAWFNISVHTFSPFFLLCFYIYSPPPPPPVVEELPIVCQSGELHVNTDPGKPTYNYQPFNITFLDQSVTYVPYGPITTSTSFDGGLTYAALSVGGHEVVSVVSDTELSKSCDFRIVVRGKSWLNVMHTIMIAWYIIFALNTGMWTLI